MTLDPQKILDVPMSVLGVMRSLLKRGYKTWIVGGAIRDLILGKNPHDWDLATTATPTQVQEIFPHLIPTGIEHGTVTIEYYGEHHQVTTLRSESTYSDGRRPDSVEFGTDIVTDLSRRDLTINAMAWNPLLNEFVDPFGGLADLAKKEIRAVGTASQRFAEDGLRALRAVRFACQLGYSLDKEVLQALHEPNLLAKISVERSIMELRKISMSPRVSLGLRLLCSSGLMKQILPGFKGLTIEMEEGLSKLDDCDLFDDDKLALVLFLLTRNCENVQQALSSLKLNGGTFQTALRLESEKDTPIPPPGYEMRKLYSKLTPIDYRNWVWSQFLIGKIEDRNELTEWIGRVQGVPVFAVRHLELGSEYIRELLREEDPPAVIGECQRWILDEVLQSDTYFFGPFDRQNRYPWRENFEAGKAVEFFALREKKRNAEADCGT